jgi:DinB superfamily
MSPRELETLLERLAASQSELSDLLVSVAGSQDWRPEPGEWSFRFLAAHLATAEQECFQDRILRIAEGNSPSFAYYLNTARDFSSLDLQASLRTWGETRLATFRFLRLLPEAAWLQTGDHITNGPITIWDVLVSMSEHDQEHLQDLRLKVRKYKDEQTPKNDGR